MTVVLAGDVGPAVGLGHRRRLEALGAALQTRGCPTRFVPIADDGAAPDTDDADVLVIDSYLTRADDADRYRADVIVAIDELDRGLAVDLVIDPTPGVAGDMVIVDPTLRDFPVAPIEAVRSMLVTLGASPLAGDAAALAGAIAAAHPELRIALAVGPWIDGPVPAGVEVVAGTDGLGSVLRGADLVLTAGGVTMLEACVLGRPTIAVTMADNQRRAVDALIDRRGVVGATIDTAVDVAHALIGDIDLRRALSERARGAVDGRGADRSADAILRLMSAPP